MYYNPYNDNPDVYSDLDVRQGINRFYEHINGTGMSITLNSGNDLASTGPWGDNISSVLVAPRTLVILFEHINFGGDVKILENRSDTSRLFNIHHDFNDRASSIKTFRLC